MAAKVVRARRSRKPGRTRARRVASVPAGAEARAAIERAVAAATSRGEPASLAVVDVDEFHALNRLLGEERADEVLSAVFRRVGSSAPGRAIVGRLAGDVLGLALPGLEPEQALIALQGVCDAVGRTPVAAGRGAGRRNAYPTVSAGVTPVEAGARLDDALARAQSALRRAKALGGGRVAAPGEDPMVLKSSYYPRTQLERLRALAQRLSVPEAALLREALEDVLLKHKAKRG